MFITASFESMHKQATQLQDDSLHIYLTSKKTQQACNWFMMIELLSRIHSCTHCRHCICNGMQIRKVTRIRMSNVNKSNVIFKNIRVLVRKQKSNSKERIPFTDRPSHVIYSCKKPLLFLTLTTNLINISLDE